MNSNVPSLSAVNSTVVTFPAGVVCLMLNAESVKSWNPPVLFIFILTLSPFLTSMLLGTNLKLDDSRSMLKLYTKLLAFRKEQLIPGRPVEIDVHNDNVLAYTRVTKDDKRILILLNFSENSEAIDTRSLDVLTGKLLFTTSLDKNQEAIDLKNFVLSPKEGYIYLL